MRIKGFGRRRDTADIRDYPTSSPKLPAGFTQQMLQPLVDAGVDRIEVDIRAFDREPTAFHYQLAQSFQGLQYARLDLHDMPGDDIVEACRGSLLRGWPFAFGCTCYDSLDDAADGDIPWP